MKILFVTSLNLILVLRAFALDISLNVKSRENYKGPENMGVGLVS